MSSIPAMVCRIPTSKKGGKSCTANLIAVYVVPQIIQMAARARNARVRGSVLIMGQKFEKFTGKSANSTLF
jgi:NAD-dependent DNA ligase